jgi:hypothetical protein
MGTSVSGQGYTAKKRALKRQQRQQCQLVDVMGECGWRVAEWRGAGRRPGPSHHAPLTPPPAFYSWGANAECEVF